MAEERVSQSMCACMCLAVEMRIAINTEDRSYISLLTDSVLVEVHEGRVYAYNTYPLRLILGSGDGSVALSRVVRTALGMGSSEKNRGQSGSRLLGRQVVEKYLDIY